MTTHADATTTSPHEIYTKELELARTEGKRWSRLERWLSNLRLLVFAVGALVAWLAFGTHQLAGAWIWPLAIGFLALAIAHDRVISKRRRSERVVVYFEGGLARLEERYAGQGNAGERFQDPAHPYADDLDLFGRGSLFELVCTTRTTAGEDHLARWLMAPSSAEEACSRQQAVRELAPRVELRKDLALLGEEVGEEISSEILTGWGDAPQELSAPVLPLAAGLVSALSIAALCLWIFSDAGPLPFIAALVVQAVFAGVLRSRIKPVLDAAQAPTRNLTILAGLLSRLEHEPMEAAHLQALKARLETAGRPPSDHIRQLRRLVDLMEARQNQFFAPFGALLLWGTQIGLAIERWRARCGAALGPWVAAASEMEALCSLAGYAFEHPGDVYPEIVPGPPVFDGRGLGHPLLPESACVRNDVHLGGEPTALMMSGSNMSGKSTLLRTVGCNTLLALAGAPVRAESLRLSPLQIAASIRISDSLQSGQSHFFAEITRLRQVVELTEAERCVLFLLDEVLHGTNSYDRRIGADAVVRGLVDRGALGIVTTHDLALAKIADELSPAVVNVHFEDQIVDGEMRFDYKLRAGVVTKSNAIALMRSVGLDV